MLTPQLKLVGIADDATSITLQENTGAYSTSNTGGFGTPNPAQGTISGVILVATQYSNINIQAPYRLSSTEQASFFSAGVSLLATQFSVATLGGVFQDGVFDFKYECLFQSTGISAVRGSKQFTLTNANTILAGAVGIVFPDNLSLIYYIDKSQPLTNAGGYVTSPFLASKTGNFEFSYEGDLKVLVDKAGYNCWLRDVGIWAEDNCQQENFRHIWTRYKQRIAMTTKFGSGMYYDAHNLAVKVASYCSPHVYSNCGCN